MSYKMKGFSGFKSPLKQDKKVPGSDWNMDDYLVDGKPAREIVEKDQQKYKKKIAEIGKQDKSPKSLKEILKKGE